MPTTRRRSEEWMDHPDASPSELDRSLRFIRRINRLLGYTRATLGHLDVFSRTWPRNQRIDILDLATGSADVPQAILRWADRHHFDLRIVALDRHPFTIRRAADSDPRLHLVQTDALTPPFPDNSFDYVLCSMFLHHLDDEQAVLLLRQMNRLARRGILLADLLRTRRASAWIWFFTLLTNPMVRHDARASVAQAFSAGEVLSLRHRAGIDYARYHRHFGHRFILAGERPSRPMHADKDLTSLSTPIGG